MSYNCPSAKLGNGRHAFVGEAFEDGGADGLALLVVQHGDGADQVGPFGAARLFAVTEGAIGSVQLLSARGRGRIGRRTESQELPRVASAAASAAAPAGRDVFLRAQNRRRKKEGEYVGRSGTMHYPSTGLAAASGPILS